MLTGRDIVTAATFVFCCGMLCGGLIAAAVWGLNR